MKGKECLQQIIGNCTGCDVREMVLEKRRPMGTDEKKALIQRVQESLCPKDTQMLVPNRTKQRIW